MCVCSLPSWWTVRQINFKPLALAFQTTVDVSQYLNFLQYIQNTHKQHTLLLAVHWHHFVNNSYILCAVFQVTLYKFYIFTQVNITIKVYSIKQEHQADTKSQYDCSCCHTFTNITTNWNLIYTRQTDQQTDRQYTSFVFCQQIQSWNKRITHKWTDR